GAKPETPETHPGHFSHHCARGHQYSRIGVPRFGACDAARPHHELRRDLSGPAKQKTEIPRLFLPCWLFVPVRACLISVLLTFMLAGRGQELRFERYTTSDGLLSDDVYNLRQDHTGYIWAFTNYGAAKYSGATFRP